MLYDPGDKLKLLILQVPHYICHNSGISRKNGITSHGLRHERLNELYTEKTGQASPIKSKSSHQAPNQATDPELTKIARQEVSEVAGHSRPSISGAYLGQ